MTVAVSVIIPFRGRISWLREAVDSVLAQTFRNFELILVDDGSPEDVSGQSWMHNELVHYVRQDPRGPGAARNHGVRLARGKYVAFLDSDDLFLPEKLEIQHREMEARHDVALSHTSYERMDAEGRFLEVINSGAFTGRVYPEILNRCVIATPTVMVRRESLREAPFDESTRIGEDVILWVRIARHHEILGIRKPLARVRIHGENAALLPAAQLEGSLNILRAAFREDASLPRAYQRKAYARVYNGVACRHLGEEEPWKALPLLVAGLRHRPANREILVNIARTIIALVWEIVPASFRPPFRSAGLPPTEHGQRTSMNEGVPGPGRFPMVSIVIPVFNGSDYLREAVDSALAQTYPILEVLVVNDGSDDDGRTDAIALSYGDRIRYFRKENGGVASALNFGIREMRGEYFSWLSHDDVYLPGKVEREVAVLEKSGVDAIIYSDYEVIDPSGRAIEIFRAGELSAPRFRMLLVTDIPVNGCTILIPRRYFGEVGLFDEKLRTTQDYDMWFRMAKRFPFLHVPEVLLRSRQHPGQGTRRMSAECLAEGNAFLARSLDEIASDRSCMSEPVLNRFFFRAAICLKRRGYFPASEHALELHLRFADGSSLRSAIVRCYYAVSDRSWVMSLPRMVRVLSNPEKLLWKVSRLFRKPV